MIVEHNGLTYNLIGDTHLGLGFKTGVPLHRRGEREELAIGVFDGPGDLERVLWAKGTAG